MEKRIRTVKPVLVILTVYTLLILAANLWHAKEGNFLTWRGMQSHYHAASIYMLYGTVTMISIFCWLKEDGKEFWRYVFLGFLFLYLTFYVNKVYHNVFAHTPYEVRWQLHINFPIIIYICIMEVTYLKTNVFSGKPLTAPAFFLIALVSGGLVKLWALWSIINSGEDVFSWELVAFHSMSLLICCLIMCAVYWIALTAAETKMNQQMKLPAYAHPLLVAFTTTKMKLPVLLKIWFIWCIWMHLLMAYHCWIALYAPEKNGLIFHLGVVVGLGAMLFNKRIGWTLFCLPTVILLFTQSHFWLSWLIEEIHPKYSLEFVITDYFGLPESFLLVVELIVAWYFVGRKQNQYMFNT